MNTAYDRFANLLEDKGMKPSDVSKKSGISSTVLTEWKKGKSIPKTDKLIAIARAIDTSVEYLVTGEGPANVDKTRALMDEALLTRELLGNEEYNLVIEYRKMNRDKDALHAQNADEIRLLREFRAIDAGTRKIILAALDKAFEESESEKKDAHAKIA